MKIKCQCQARWKGIQENSQSSQNSILYFSHRKWLELTEIGSTNMASRSEENLLVTDLSYNKYPLATVNGGRLNDHQVLEVLEALSQNIQSGDPSNSPKQFSTLKDAMVNLDQEELVYIANSILGCKSKTKCNKVKEGLFWDALLGCGTNNCLRIAVNQMKKERATPKLRSNLLMVLTNSVRPDRETISIIQVCGRVLMQILIWFCHYINYEIDCVKICLLFLACLWISPHRLCFR